MLFIHGKKDTLIPYEHSQLIMANFKGKSEFHFPEEMDHNQFQMDEDVLIPIKKFLEKNTLYDSENYFLNDEFQFPRILYEKKPIIIKKSSFTSSFS